jgi:lipopolysaccharide/colanic/teichoic acid biosynthesis glycosyltransferase
MPVMEASSVTIEPMERVAKRLMDVIGSSVGIIILSPLFVIIALAIKLEDPSGPIIYKNRRI